MATTRRLSKTRRKVQSLGQLACGASGAWDIAIDETTGVRPRWYMNIDGLSVNLNLEISSLTIVAKLLHFLGPRHSALKPLTNGTAKRFDQLILGKNKKVPVTLVRDNEYDDRFFLVIGPRGKFIAQITIAAKDVASIRDALIQVQEDLDADE